MMGINTRIQTDTTTRINMQTDSALMLNAGVDTKEGGRKQGIDTPHASNKGTVGMVEGCRVRATAMALYIRCNQFRPLFSGGFNDAKEKKP
jgi:hypothetical protein